MTPPAYIVAALYKFTPFDDLEAHRTALRAAAAEAGTCGTLLLAHEGINGTIAGSRAGIDQLLGAIRELPGCADVPHKESHAAEKPFGRMKVRIKREIVTMGVPTIDPTAIVGTYVPPREWNELITAPDVVTIDTRNDYEVAIGTFSGARNPEIPSFREFPGWVRENLKPGEGKRVAMFCTGGIRCEKSTAYLKTLGFEEVYHLEGGILKYLEEIPADESLWQGDCFVFDERVAVGTGLRPGAHEMCSACGWPVERGGDCKRCDRTTDDAG